MDGVSLSSLGTLGVLGLGFILGLKHATEVDHVVAVATLVSELRSMRRALIIGGLWGVGHTVSLVVVGLFVLAIRTAVPEILSAWLEFGVALMILGLGFNALRKAFGSRPDLHIHTHAHDGLEHAHIHFHEQGNRHDIPMETHSHLIRRVGVKPLIVGVVHGLAGSAPLTLLVLTQIKSIPLGLLYLGIFGIGSILGMLLMSGLVGLPFTRSSKRLAGLPRGLQISAGVLSICFGFWYAYRTGAGTLLFGLLYP